ncbi:MAG: DUF268 domain-containing protein [Betaproteobacteria bacterium]
MRPVVNRSTTLRSMTFAEWDAAPSAFDVVVALDVVEHAGLGMHGDPLDPNGDLAAMAMLKKMVGAEGLLLLAIPIGIDRLVFNATRVYGRVRLPILLDGWTTVQSAGFKYNLLFDAGTTRPVMLLRQGAA